MVNFSHFVPPQNLETTVVLEKNINNPKFKTVCLDKTICPGKFLMSWQKSD
jgi:hypothetical protein